MASQQSETEGKQAFDVESQQPSERAQVSSSVEQLLKERSGSPARGDESNSGTDAKVRQADTGSL